MSVRITHLEGSRLPAFKIDGWLQAADLAELVRALVATAGVPTVDLSGLQCTDEAGFAALRGFMAGGAGVIGASAYLTRRLHSLSQPYSHD
jgi:ABC-type transporter Mla MlaB component